jgi:hypothetical protein
MVLGWLAVVLAGCGTGSSPGSADAGAEAGAAPDGFTVTQDATQDTAVDTGPDGGPDVTLDAVSVVPIDGACAFAGPDPGALACGAEVCDTSRQYCCAAASEAGVSRCNDDSVSACSGLFQQCDEAADCPAGGVCCTVPGQAVRLSYTTVCASRCLLPSYQVCRTDAECRNGQGCMARDCLGTCVQTCGPINPLECQ